MSDTDDLEPLVSELSETLRELESRLDDSPSRRSEFLRFTEQYAIPTTVALLEANIRMLEALGGAIRLAEGREESDRSARGETALAALDRALADVNDAVRGTPTDPDARRLLGEARDLRDEIRDRVEESRGGRPAAERSEEVRRSDAGGTTIPVTSEGEDVSETTEEEPAVDVDAELDTIRREVHGDGADENEE